MASQHFIDSSKQWHMIENNPKQTINKNQNNKPSESRTRITNLNKINKRLTSEIQVLSYDSPDEKLPEIALIIDDQKCHIPEENRSLLTYI